MDASGRVAWVTGAAGGMGTAHAVRFASGGGHVGCIDIDAAGLQRVARAVRDAGGTPATVAADVSDWTAMREAAERLRAALGDVDTVVANAGVLPLAANVADTDPAAWRRVLAVNLDGAFHTAKAAIPQMWRAGGGCLVLVSSTAGLAAGPGYASYYASKHGVIGLMRSLANELAGDGIRVNAVCPGWVDTPMLDQTALDLGVDRDEAARLCTADQLIRRVITPEEVSDAIWWLCSDRAAMITGVALPVDGGLLEHRYRA